MAFNHKESLAFCKALIKIKKLNLAGCEDALSPVVGILEEYEREKQKEKDRLKEVERMKDDSAWDYSEVAPKYIDFLNGEYKLPQPYKEFSEIPRKSSGLIDKQALYVELDKYVLYSHCPHPIYKGVKYHGTMNYWVEGEPIDFPLRPNRHYLQDMGKYWCPKCKGIFELKKGRKKLVCNKCQKYKKNYKTEAARERARRKNRRRAKMPFFNLNRKMSETVVRFLSGRVQNPVENLYWDILGVSPSNLVGKIGSMSYGENTNLDHIVPFALVTEIYKRKSIDFDMQRLFAAYWHYSNLQVLSKEENQYEKQDYIDGVRPMNMDDCHLINIADELIRKSEAVRVADRKGVDFKGIF